MDRAFTHFSAMLLPSLTVLHTVPCSRPEYAGIHSRCHDYADVVAVTVVVAFVSFFFMQDVGVSVYLKDLC